MKHKTFRKGVGAFLVNNNKHVFIAKRVFPNNAWQMPQGGIEYNEPPRDAILRELLEEIGTNKVDIILQTPPTQYTFPNNLTHSKLCNKYIGQEIIWFGLLFKGTNLDINLKFSPNYEFTEWKWATTNEILKLIVEFKKNMYLTVINYMKSNNII